MRIFCVHRLSSLREKVVSIGICFVVVHFRESGKVGCRQRSVCTGFLYNGIRAVAVVHHEIDVRRSLARVPSGVGIFRVKFNSGNRFKAILLVKLYKIAAIAVKLCAAESDSLRNRAFCSAFWCSLGFVGKHRFNVAVLRNGKSGRPVRVHERTHTIFGKLLCCFRRDSPSMVCVCAPRLVQSMRKRDAVCRNVLRFHNINTACFKYVLRFLA